MDPIAVFAIGLVGLIFGLARSEARRVRRRIARAQRWSLGEMPEATVGRVTGRVRVIGEPIRSPLTGRACVFYVAELRSDFEPSSSREVGGVAFVLEDDSGRALVDPEHASAALSLEITGCVGRSDVTPAESAMFARHMAGTPRTLNGLQNWTFLEAVIEPGATIEVLGAGTREPDPGASIGPDVYRGVSATRLRIAWARGFPLAISG